VTVDSVDINATIERVKKLLQDEKDLSPAMVASLEMLLLVVTLLVGKLGLNSRNSSKPPSSDPNREKTIL
jgi:transposase